MNEIIIVIKDGVVQSVSAPENFDVILIDEDETEDRKISYIQRKS